MSEIVVDHETQAHLLSCMRVLIERWGAEAYLTAPILEPTDRDFPDTFAPGLKGVRTVARRMASYAGLGGVGVDVMGKPDADPDPLVHSEIVLSRVERHEIELAVVEPGRPEDLPIILAQEIARAFLALRAPAHLNADHPYRTPELEPDEGSDDANELEVTVTAMYLGFGLLVAYIAGRAVPRAAVCTHCEALSPEDATSCPGCGGSVRGTIGVGESRLDVEERLERESTEAQTDADPRYVELHVACPHCGWIPDGLAHWGCDECEVPGFNTFEHGGECPGCGEVSVATFCPACGHVAAYEHWWPDDDPGEDLPPDP